MGANGGGKSNLATTMIEAGQYPSWVIFDNKGDFKAPRPYTLIRTPMDWRWRFAERVLYRPSEQYDTPAWNGEVLKRLYFRAKRLKGRGFLLYIDEGLDFIHGEASRWLSMIAKNGRSLNLGLWVSSQRPRNIPVSVRSEAWRWYVFYLGYEDDEVEVVKYSKGQISVDDLEALGGDYSFWEIRRPKKGGRLEATKYPPCRLAS